MNFKFGSVAACVALAACGGGGGGGRDWLTFDPPSIQATFYRGDSMTVSIVATSTKVLEGPVQIGVFDSAGVLGGAADLVQSGMNVQCTLPLAPGLSVGRHTGSLQIRVCKDDPVSCSSPWGGPWTLPYDITVLEGTNLTTLTPLSGAGPWQTLGGESGHTAYVPATIDPASFSRRWGVQASARGIAIDGGRIFLLKGGFSAPWTVTALSEADGQAAWTYDLGTLFWVGGPAAAHGHVYVASGSSTQSALWVIDQATGDLAKALPMSSQWDRYGTPEVYGDYVYAAEGYYGGFAKWNGVRLTQAWAASGVWYMDAYTGLADADHLYLHTGNDLLAWNTSDGTEAFRIAGSTTGMRIGEAPVLGSGGTIYHTMIGNWDYSKGARAGQLQCFDVVAQTNPWNKEGWYNSQPAIANGVLYIVNANLLEALDTGTGERLWTWTIPDQPDQNVRQQVVVIGHHAFVTSSRALYVVDLNTHQQAWSYPLSGQLAVSENGVLYILAANRLVAINLH